MKAILCEMCRSNDLIKQDGYYVCQHCGTKYTLEEAKKLMVEIDSSKKTANLYERARKSLEVDDLEHAAEYYKQILDEIPNDWEAYFYSYLGETTSFTNAQAGGVAAKLGKTIPTAYDMAIERATSDEVAERVKIISEKVAGRLTAISATGEYLLRQYEGGNTFTPAGSVQSEMYAHLRPTAQNTIVNCVIAFDPLTEKVESIFMDGKISEETRKECLLVLLCAKYDISNKRFYPSATKSEKMITYEVIRECAQKIKELNPDFQVPEPQPENASGGCYVATAIYGSYDCPQVWTLRRFRDHSLSKTWYGRTFVRIYYATSPTLVKLFGKTNWFKNLWKPTLDRMVEKLNRNGVEDTPYDDCAW